MVLLPDDISESTGSFVKAYESAKLERIAARIALSFRPSGIIDAMNIPKSATESALTMEVRQDISHADAGRSAKRPKRYSSYQSTECVIRRRHPGTCYCYAEYLVRDAGAYEHACSERSARRHPLVEGKAHENVSGVNYKCENYQLSECSACIVKVEGYVLTGGSICKEAGKEALKGGETVIARGNSEGYGHCEVAGTDWKSVLISMYE